VRGAPPPKPSPLPSKNASRVSQIQAETSGGNHSNVNADTVENMASPRSIISKSPPKSLKEMLEAKADAKKAEAKVKVDENKEEEKDDVGAADTLAEIDLALAEIPAMPKRHRFLERTRCQGYLTKQGHHKNSWKRRWFVMKLSHLYFFKKKVPTETETQPHPKEQGKISLTSIVRIERDIINFPQAFSFQLVCKDRVFALQADDKKDMDLWVNEINDAVRAVKIGVDILGSDAFAAESASSKLNRRASMSAVSGRPEDMGVANRSANLRKIFEEERAKPLGKLGDVDTREVTSKKKSLLSSRNSVVGLYGLEKRVHVDPLLTKRGDSPSKTNLLADKLTGTSASSPSRFAAKEAAASNAGTTDREVVKDLTKEDPKMSALKNSEEREEVFDSTPLMTVIDEAPKLTLTSQKADEALKGVRLDFALDLGKYILQKRADGMVERGRTLDALEDATRVGIYFGADWCTSCHAFLPTLVEYYTHLRTEGRDIEIIFVSNDNNVQSFTDYYTYNMPWLAVPFNEDRRRFKMAEMMHVDSIPSLVFLDGTGRVVTSQGIDFVLHDTHGKQLFQKEALSSGLSSPGASPVNPIGSVYGSVTSSTRRPLIARSIHSWREEQIGAPKLAEASNFLHKQAKSPLTMSSIPSLPAPPEEVELPIRTSPHHNDSPSKSSPQLVVEGNTHGSGKKGIKRSEAYRRRLLKEKQQRLKMTPRILAQYVMWLDTLHVSPAPIGDLYRELRSGVLLCGIVKTLVPDAIFKSINTRPRTMRPAINNIEQALAVIWQKGRPNARRMPTSKEIFEAKSERISWLVREIFECFEMRAIRSKSRCKKMMGWYHEILEAYGRQLRQRTTTFPYEGNSFAKSIWEDFHDGVNFACVIHYFCGSEVMDTFPGVKFLEIYEHPHGIDQFENNVSYVFDLLTELGVPLVWSSSDFINFPDESFMLWQVNALYTAFNGLTCSLPEIPFGEQTSEEAITIDAYGKPLVINTIFRSKDARSSYVRGVSHKGLEHHPGIPVGLSPYSKSPPSRDGEWNKSTLSPDKSLSERGSNLAVNIGNTNMEQYRYQTNNYQTLAELTPAREIEHVRTSGETFANERAREETGRAEEIEAVNMFRSQLRELEREKQYLLDAELLVFQETPTTAHDIERAVQLKEKRLMLQEEQRRTTELLRELLRERLVASGGNTIPTGMVVPDHLVQDNVYAEPLSTTERPSPPQRQPPELHHSPPLMREIGRAVVNANRWFQDEGMQHNEQVSQPNAVYIHTPPPPPPPDDVVSPHPPPPTVGSPTAAEDAELRRRNAIRWLSEQHLVDLQFSNGSTLRDQQFYVSVDQNGSNVFMWQGPGLNEGEIGVLPEISVTDHKSGPNGEINLYVDSEVVCIRAVNPMDHMRMAAHFETLFS
jgi:thiol-disulfide isomerase/thioredoxin